MPLSFSCARPARKPDRQLEAAAKIGVALEVGGMSLAMAASRTVEYVEVAEAVAAARVDAALGLVAEIAVPLSIALVLNEVTGGSLPVLEMIRARDAHRTDVLAKVRAYYAGHNPCLSK